MRGATEVDTARTGMTATIPPPAAPTLLTTASLARIAQVHRATINRLLAQQRIRADGFVIEGDTPQPVFIEARAAEVRAALNLPAA